MKRLAICLIAIVWCLPWVAFAAPQLRVVATVPELGDITRQVGGDAVEVSTIARGTEDPHFVQAKPSFVKDLSRADALVLVGLELEQGWLPPLLQTARNAKLEKGSRGYIDASEAIIPLELPVGIISRAQGDVHALGNPHYLLDPKNGILVARLIAEKLAEISPELRLQLQGNLQNFEKRLGGLLFGATLATKYDVRKLLELLDLGGLENFLQSQHEEAAFTGLLSGASRRSALKVVGDHAMWPYFARRANLQMVEHLEPLPGVLPTTKHLGEVIALMNKEGVSLILTNPYYDPKHAEFVASNTKARILRLAHQVGAREETESYEAFVRYNFEQVSLKR